MIECILCGKEFKRISWKHLHFKHGLTTEEYRELGGLVGSEKFCLICGNMFIPACRKQKTCSSKCGWILGGQILSGENNPNWGRHFHHSEETKRKISKHNARYWQGKKRGPRSKDEKERISEGMTKFLADCAKRDMFPYQSGYYISPIAGQVWLHSSFEFRFAKVLDVLKWEWYRNKDYFAYRNLAGETKHSLPDFKIIHFGKPIYYETKGWLNDLESEKILALQRQISLIVITEKLLQVYENWLKLSHGIFQFKAATATQPYLF